MVIRSADLYCKTSLWWKLRCAGDIEPSDQEIIFINYDRRISLSGKQLYIIRSFSWRFAARINLANWWQRRSISVVYVRHKQKSARIDTVFVQSARISNRTSHAQVVQNERYCLPAFLISVWRSLSGLFLQLKRSSIILFLSIVFPDTAPALSGTTQNLSPSAPPTLFNK